MCSLNNVDNWGKLYKTPFDRWKDMHSEYLDEFRWNGTCIRCNGPSRSKGFRHCDKCCKEYEKYKKKVSSKARNLLKRKTNVYCNITGCDKKQLRSHLESLFDDKMNWDNQSSYWQIDHHIPLSWFNLEDKDELFYSCNYLNLKPVEKNLNESIKNYNFPNQINNYPKIRIHAGLIK